jgi:hypothetical protein
LYEEESNSERVGVRTRTASRSLVMPEAHRSTSRVATAKAVIYMKQLCRHFGHKCPVQWKDTDGWIEFPYGRCDLEARADLLEIRAAADEDASLGRLEKVIGVHLERFAFREALQVQWVRDPQVDTSVELQAPR